MKFRWKKDARNRVEWLKQAYRAGVVMGRQHRDVQRLVGCGDISPAEFRYAVWGEIMDTRPASVPYVDDLHYSDQTFDAPWDAVVAGYED